MRTGGRDARPVSHISSSRTSPLDAELTSVLADETAKNRAAAEQAGTVAAAVGVDAQTWRITRILLSEQEPRGVAGEEAYQILHLAKPLLDTLPL
jgi:hypothetical protein